MPLLLTAAPSEAPDYASSIEPLLTARCISCHPSSGGQAGLSLASHADVLRGGNSGPAVVPGDPSASLLLRRVSGESPTMPLVGAPLTPSEVALLERWIATGARLGAENDGAQDQTWWSFRKLVRPPVPRPVSAWGANPIDRFVAERLAEKGLSPSRPADRATLIRRLSYNLHGLPPSPEEVDAFVNDSSPEAYQRLVDRLLASPRYGERWGRHWLDVAHYGESHGYDKDKARRNSWPYRDYVIESFNRDKPYARFIREQIAGDVLWPGEPDSLVATGFVAAGPWDYVGHAELREGTKDKKLARLLDRDDMVAATMSSFTSLTVHCARCHDHKFDPIQQADYYALQAVFAGVDRAEQPYFHDPETHSRGRRLWLAIGKAEAALRPFRREIEDATSGEIRRIDEQESALKQERADLLPKVGEIDTPESIARRNEISGLIKQLDAERRAFALAAMSASDRARYSELSERLDALNAEFGALPDPRYVYSAANYFKTYGRFTPAWEPRPVHLLAKGSVESPQQLAQPGAVAAVAGLEARFGIDSAQGEGAARAALAAWLAHRDNPLTWRSIANRVWHYHFGRGLVETPNDFGRMGASPTHPALLDWLAAQVRTSGGSLKHLHRLILLSATYRQSSAERSDQAKIDAGNQFLWRMNRTRLDAEAVRDSVLAVAGQIDLQMGGPSAEHFFFKDDHSPVYDYTRFDFSSAAARRRSVYRFLVRSVQDPFMESLDCADPSLLVPKRSSTLTAIQALALLNDPLMIEQARHFADRLRAVSTESAERLRHGFRLAYGRSGSDSEVAALAEYSDRHGLESAARLLFNGNEFIFVD
ncbi:MAG: DUF1549 domain-containing protein [Bryobacterales bacterium]|nr:DUF1549 domain-containing protein [Bryobacterales bacterium]MDE0621770.1 DUF1549 domain-containing protein [Bryobacterales bacterium]